ncbi:lipoyl(octanoyl) transferase LipB [Jiangella asiatica]|uniref:Octanoyltransferase n=1 Tax=Jiangella asiatica TaxID=2530372 RepID=A0A4R5DNC5_9ACTN|nr:lipoyl(octanoyl) transferase LipB [Jiangella asiatica]
MGADTSNRQFTRTSGGLRVVRYEGLVPYQEAWAEQRRLHAARLAGDEPDTVMLLEHEPVYTAGKRTAPEDRPLLDAGAPVIDVDRGGKITWHGPGQIVGYPIVALPEPYDVVAYVRRVEQIMIDVCREFGVDGVRVETAGRSGVWVQPGDGSSDRKIGAVGLRVARGVTMHGFSLNCDNDLGWYDRIVPCGITDAATTTLSKETGRRITVGEVLPYVERHLDVVLAPDSRA